MQKITLKYISLMHGERWLQSGWIGRPMRIISKLYTNTMEKKNELVKDVYLLMDGVQPPILCINFMVAIGMVAFV